MSIQDRTNEFKACVDSINNRSAFGKRGADSKQRLIQTKSANKGEFSRMASAIGKEISSTTIKLNKLGQRASPLFFFQQVPDYDRTVAKRKTLFDDRPVEISVRFI